MKKFLMLLLALAMMICPAMAEESDWYLDTAMELAGKVGELAKDDAYIELMSSQTFASIEPLKAADFGKMISAYRCELPDEAGVRVMMQAASGKLSDAALEVQISQLPKFPLTMYAAKLGSEAMSVSVILTYKQTYVMPENFEPCIYVIELDGAVVSAAFCKTGEDTVTVEVQPLFGKDEGTMEDLLNALVEDNLPIASEKVY